jgi:hypothetical protein
MPTTLSTESLVVWTMSLARQATLQRVVGTGSRFDELNVPRINSTGAITGVIAVVAILLVHTLLSCKANHRRQKRKGTFSGLTPVPGFSDTNQNEELVSIRFPFRFLIEKVDKLCHNCSIIYVHGLGSDPISSWPIIPEAELEDAHIHDSKNTRSISWVQDFLAGDLREWNPEARNSVRAYCYGYKSDWMVDEPVVRVDSLARGFLGAIAAMRTTEERRMVFVAHSHGGLVVKQALRTDFEEKSAAGLFSRTKGVLFFRTPHRGSDLAGFGRFIAMGQIPWGADGDILKFVMPSSNANHELHNGFTNVLKSVDRQGSRTYSGLDDLNLERWSTSEHLPKTDGVTGIYMMAINNLRAASTIY